MAQGVKKINEARFAEIKQHITKHGIESATAKWPGYNRRTFASISRQPDYKTWRDKRRTKAQKSAPAAKAVAEPQALQSVAPAQSVTTTPKRPGHGRTVHRVVTRVGVNDDVTREEFDRVTNNMLAQMNTLKLRCDRVRTDVDSLMKEDAAYREAEILLRDKGANSLTARIKRAVKQRRRS